MNSDKGNTQDVVTLSEHIVRISHEMTRIPMPGLEQLVAVQSHQKRICHYRSRNGGPLALREP